MPVSGFIAVSPGMMLVSTSLWIAHPTSAATTQAMTINPMPRATIDARSGREVAARGGDGTACAPGEGAGRGRSCEPGEGSVVPAGSALVGGAVIFEGPSSDQ